MRSEVNEILEIQRWCGKGGQKTFDEKRQVTFGYTDNDNQIVEVEIDQVRIQPKGNWNGWGYAFMTHVVRYATYQ